MNKTERVHLQRLKTIGWRFFFANHFPSIASSNLPIHFLALPLNRRVRQTLIILCSIENHHEKINSFFHTLLVLGIVFARRPTRFFSGMYSSIHLRGFFSWRFLLLGELQKKRRTENTRQKHALGCCEVFQAILRWTNFRHHHRALIRFGSNGDNLKVSFLRALSLFVGFATHNNSLKPWFNVCMGPLAYPISTLHKLFVQQLGFLSGLTKWTKNWSIKSTSSFASSTWFRLFFNALSYSATAFISLVLRWNPLFGFVIVMMTNQMRTRVENEARKEEKKERNQKNKLSVEWKLGCWVMGPR